LVFVDLKMFNPLDRRCTLDEEALETKLKQVTVRDLDTVRAKKGKKRSQNTWIRSYNWKKDRILLSMGELYKIMKQLHADGIQVKDTRIGLMDLYALRGTSIVHLCWKAGEREVTHWHPIESGYSKRQQIDREEFFGE